MIVVALTLSLAAAGEVDQPGLDFFEERIRPVLVERCYKCHSAKSKSVKGELRLDTRAGIRKGGETGPAVVPGKPEESLLIQAIRYESLEMPPKGKLPDRVIADFVTWIRAGAPDPRVAAGASRKSQAIDFVAARKHWAYQPVRRPELPEVRDENWPTAQVDRFILARLEANELTPAHAADRRTLIRRAYYDLIGLPPTYAEVESFVNDPSPTAFATIVDRLLESPHYGERWGRHWLDVARYADTKDLVLLYGRDSIRPYAYTYRDYVIKAFNADLPYDRFIHEQLAADRLAEHEPDLPRWRLGAMGFLTLGRLFDNNLPDVYDDRIDTVTRGLLGMTVSCARCHDHKYDAIPTADYYSLYGVFASSKRPIEAPLIEAPEGTPGGIEFEAKVAPKRQELIEHIDSQYAEITETARLQVTDYLVKVATEKPDPLEGAVFFMSLSPDQLKPQIVIRWRRHLQSKERRQDPVFGPWRELMDAPAESFRTHASQTTARWRQVPQGTERGQLNPLVAEALAGSTLSSRVEVARLFGDLLKRAYVDAKDTKSDALPPADTQLVSVLTSQESPIYFPKGSTYLYMPRVERDKYHKTLLEIDIMAVKDNGAAPRAMVLVDTPDPYDPRIFVRGNPVQLGERVPRQFLGVLSSETRTPFSRGGGRLDLAQAITAKDNPLTSRVMVNRVWMHHFGQPLVDTPSDFGVRSQPPSHPDLLDHLAWSFQNEDDWTLKKLHRRIMLSSTYQQASIDRPRMRQVDPDNRWLWRFRRRRLDFESMRDTLLVASGRLDRTLFGRAVDVAGDPENRRRTVYGLVDRQNLPGLYRAFDFASPDQSAARRPQTTVPQQALFAMNSPFMITQAKALSDLTKKELNPERRLTSLYRHVLAREPDAEESARALRFIAASSAETIMGEPSAGDAELSAWEQYAQVLLSTNELMFVD